MWRLHIRNRGIELNLNIIPVATEKALAFKVSNPLLENTALVYKA